MRSYFFPSSDYNSEDDICLASVSNEHELEEIIIQEDSDSDSKENLEVYNVHTSLLGDLKNTFIQIDEETKDIPVVITPEAKTSPTHSFLLGEINACIKITEKAKENIPSFIEFKKWTYYYTSISNLAYIALELCASGGSVSTLFALRDYIVKPAEDALQNFTRFKKSFEENYLNTSSWKLRGPKELEDRLDSIWSNWREVKIANYRNTVDCTIFDTDSHYPPFIPYTLVKWQDRSKKWESIQKETPHFDSRQKIFEQKIHLCFIDTKQDCYEYIANSNLNNPCFLNQVGYFHPAPHCNVPSAEACHIYQQLPQRINNSKYEYDARLRTAYNFIEETELVGNLKKANENDGMIWSYVGLGFVNIVLLGGLGLIASKWRNAYDTYKNDLEYSHSVATCIHDDLEYVRIRKLCFRLNINLNDLPIEKLQKTLRKIADELYLRQKCRLTFLNTDVARTLNRDMQSTILEMAELHPKQFSV